MNAGLCDTCRHARVVRSDRSRFVLCRRSETDAAYPKYPRVPVETCPGHDPLGDPRRERV